MQFTAAFAPQSSASLMEAPRQVSAPRRLRFLGVEGYDVYNISTPFSCGGRTYIAGRVEKRENELSFVRLFEQSGEDEYTAVFPKLSFQRLQDPFVTKVQDEIVLGGVQIVTHPLDEKRIISWQTLFLKGKTPEDLKLFAVGPSCMKDIRLCELADGRIAVFTRPQGKKGGLGKIGFTVLDRLKDLCADTILDAAVDGTYFLPEEWGGANDIHLLKNGLLGVAGHIACRTAEGLHYRSMAFILDPVTGEHGPLRVIACRSDISSSPASKRQDLMDVLFTGGVVRHGNGLATLYTGVSDCESWRAEIPDPFADCEK
jgi:hypothetical protein